jgi:hypothetical protein
MTCHQIWIVHNFLFKNLHPIGLDLINNRLLIEIINNTHTHTYKMNESKMKNKIWIDQQKVLVFFL